MAAKKQRILAVILVALVVVGVSMGTVFAYLSAKSGSVSNTFIPETQVNPSIEETFDHMVKKDVKVDVGNPGYAVYVRAVIVVTWEDEHGNVYAQAPEDTDYTLELGDGWFKEGNFYYHKEMVPTGGETGVLIACCERKVAAPAGYQLHVEIIAQTIQALGETDGNNPIPAVTDAWGIPVEDGKLVPKS